MEWYQVLSIIAANLAMFFWLRTEGNSDRREMTQMIREFKDEVQKEMKDFHGRLCAIEERNRK